uniref:Chemokine (C-C motif) ligand 34b, duplicate 1 n=1 Tax=Sinocyclocheilus rhinocerous TaxID=307959 RepID=A0A673N6S7_9TELE
MCLQWTADAEEVKSCCTNVSAAEVIDPIISFRMQRESLPCVKAVIFETEQGEKIRQFLKMNKVTIYPQTITKMFKNKNVTFSKGLCSLLYMLHMRQTTPSIGPTNL